MLDKHVYFLSSSLTSLKRQERRGVCLECSTPIESPVDVIVASVRVTFYLLMGFSMRISSENLSHPRKAIIESLLYNADSGLVSVAKSVRKSLANHCESVWKHLFALYQGRECSVEVVE